MLCVGVAICCSNDKASSESAAMNQKIDTAQVYEFKPDIDYDQLIKQYEYTSSSNNTGIYLPETENSYTYNNPFKYDSSYTYDNYGTYSSVYITRTGECYHKPGCTHAKNSAGYMSQSQARSKGFRPCYYCYN